MQDWSPKPLPSGVTAGPGKVEASAGQAPSKPAKGSSTTRLTTPFLVIVIPSMSFRKMFEIEAFGIPRAKARILGGTAGGSNRTVSYAVPGAPLPHGRGSVRDGSRARQPDRVHADRMALRVKSSPVPLQTRARR